MHDQDDSQTSPANNVSVLSESANAVASIFSGVPAPLQKSFFKAAGRLLGAVVDIPAAWLEQHADRIRATSDARRLLTMETAKKIAHAMPTNDSLSDRAFARNASKILGEQINLDEVVKIAAETLEKDRDAELPKGEIDEDWLDVFAAEASARSSDDVRQAFARILAGEITRPGSFSVRAVRTVAMLDRQTAVTFSKLCGLGISLITNTDVRVQWTLGPQNGNGLQRYGLTYTNFTQLVEHGLVNTDYNSYLDIRPFVEHKIPLFYLNSPFFLLANTVPDTIRLTGISLTTLGRELRRIVEIQESKEYTDDLVRHFEAHNLRVILAEARVEANGATRYYPKSVN